MVVPFLPVWFAVRVEFNNAVEVSVSALCPEVALLGIPAQLLAVIRIARHFVKKFRNKLIKGVRQLPVLRTLRLARKNRHEGTRLETPLEECGITVVSARHLFLSEEVARKRTGADIAGP